MKHQVSSKLLVLFGIICGIFFFANSGHCATVYTHGTDVNTTPIANKSSTFSTKLSNASDDDYNSNDSALAEQIRAQRAALDSRDTESGVKLQTKSGGTKNNCDTALRKCITSKCAADYSKCATDSDTIFSGKLDACKKDTNCTTREFTLFTNEIKEDKKQEIRLSAYNNTITCGTKYNDCIITACGPRFNKCLSKSAGDKAIAGCKKIATDCTEADSGLAGRIGSIFGVVRQDAEKQIKADEKKLYSLRDQMRTTCQQLGAMFDDRSLDCVFTASFFAGDDTKTPKASKKLYAGSTFDCSPDWFGIDITTFKENAYRLTRSQTAASSAMLGSGVGTAVGALTSGAIGRAIDTKKAKDALNDAQQQNDKNITNTDEEEISLTSKEKCESETSGGTYNETTKKCDCSKTTDKEEDNGICVDIKKKEICKNAGGKLNILGKCKCTDKNKIYQDNKCIDKPANKSDAQIECEYLSGTWENGQCTKTTAWIACEQSGGNWQSDNFCLCSIQNNLIKNIEKNICECTNGTQPIPRFDTITIVGGAQKCATPEEISKYQNEQDENIKKKQQEKQVAKEQHQSLCKSSGGEYKTESDTCACPSNKINDGKEGILCVTQDQFKANCTKAEGKLNKSGECICKNKLKTYKDGFCYPKSNALITLNKSECPKQFIAYQNSSSHSYYCTPNDKATCEEFGGTWGIARKTTMLDDQCVCNGQTWHPYSECAQKNPTITPTQTNTSSNATFNGLNITSNLLPAGLQNIDFDKLQKYMDANPYSEKNLTNKIKGINNNI